MSRRKRAAALLTASFVVVVGVHAPARAAEDTARYLGVAACSSTLCHGSIVARDVTSVRQNEYQIWSLHDRHARAYTALSSDRSRQIAARLGFASAETAAECLACHGVDVAERRRGPKFQISDGVSCEACHGAAEAWIQTHDNADSSRADSLSRGMIATDEPLRRAQLCLGCHQGDSRRTLSHRIMAAGHPRLSFELDTFTQLEPAHFNVDADYRRRKHAPDSAGTWAVGQAASVRAYADRLTSGLTSSGQATAGVWPEFALFDCFSCHHDIGTQSPAPRVDGVLGVPTPDVSSLLLYRELMAQVAPDGVVDLDARMRALVKASAGEQSMFAAAARRLRERVDADAHKLAATPLANADLQALLTRLVSERTAVHYRSYADAEQVTMAVQAICATLSERGFLSGTRIVRTKVALDGLFDATSSAENFRAARFQQALAKLRAAL